MAIAQSAWLLNPAWTILLGIYPDRNLCPLTIAENGYCALVSLTPADLNASLK